MARGLGQALTSQGLVFRKLIHIAFGFLAFAPAVLGPFYCALMALSAVAFNAAVLPRIGGQYLLYDDEIERGRSTGILLYPVTVLLLLLIFWGRLEVAAAAWGILAFGDGAAGLFGRAFGRRRLPWNPKKTWLGTAAYGLCGSAAATLLLGWTLTRQDPPAEVSWPFLASVATVAAVFSAWLESQPQGLDDNLGVPLLTALLLFGLLSTEAYWTVVLEPGPALEAAGLGLLVNLGFGLAAFKFRSVDLSGLAAGTVLGTVIYTFLDWPGFCVLGGFFVLGTAATRLGYRDKAARRLAQESGGRRSARHAVANAGVPTILAVLAAANPEVEYYLAAFVAAFGTAASDTLESEIGQLWGRRTVLITTFETVPRGTHGAVSPAGILAGAVAAAAFAALGWALGFYAPAAMISVAVAGFFGSIADSLLGATLERRGLLDNEGVNFTSTLAGALAAAGSTALF